MLSKSIISDARIGADLQEGTTAQAMPNVATTPRWLTLTANLKVKKKNNLNNKNINHGVFFDIFPLDYYPDSSFAQRIFESKMILYNRRIRESYPNYQPSAGIKSKISAIITRIICKDYKIAVKKKESILQPVWKTRFQCDLLHKNKFVHNLLLCNFPKKTANLPHLQDE